ncbi:MFS transporter [Burkholderia gladioli]|uniref:MFS transporter n=1 Tax=Burkholderia gladioli TaxID=28095 RepID=UPI00163E8552|nr:MFS transporter [Burkholderia gladioli]
MTISGFHSEKVLGRALNLLAPTVTIVVAAEFIIVGLLPLIAHELHIPLAQAGGLAGWFAFSAAVAGPFVTLVATRLSPRIVLTATLLLFAAGNALMAVAAGFAPMLLARVLQGAALPAFVSVGASVVTQLAPPSTHGRGLARANIGFVLGVLLALPAGVALAQGGNWRVPFVVLAVASLAMVPVVALLFPNIPKGGLAGIGGQLRLLRRPSFLAQLALSVLLFASMFASYTYVGAWIERALGLPAMGVALLLFLFGGAGLVGNMVAERFADRAPLRATAAAILLLLAAVNTTALAHGSVLLAALPLALWSIGHTASVTFSQVRVTLAGREAPSFAMTLNISAANLGIAIGTLTGGRMIDSLGINAIGLAPIIFALPAFFFIAGIGGRPSTFGSRRSAAPPAQLSTVKRGK